MLASNQIYFSYNNKLVSRSTLQQQTPEHSHQEVVLQEIWSQPPVLFSINESSKQHLLYLKNKRIRLSGQSPSKDENNSSPTHRLTTTVLLPLHCVIFKPPVLCQRPQHGQRISSEYFTLNKSNSKKNNNNKPTPLFFLFSRRSCRESLCSLMKSGAQCYCSLQSAFLYFQPS